MDWILSGRHGAWFAALDKGFYKEQGLDVKISRGWGSADGIKKLLARSHPIVFNDIGSMVKALGQGADKMRALAVIYARHPSTFFSLKKNKILKPKDLEGKTIADSVFSTQLNLFPYFAKVNSVNPCKVRWIKVQPKAKMSMLLAEKADVIGFYNMQIPLLEKKAAKLGGINAMEWGNWGVKLLSNGILIREDTLNANRDLARRFVHASMKGFQSTVKDPQSAADSMKKRFPLLDSEVTLKEVKIVSKIVQTSEAKEHGLGYISPEKVQVTIDEMTRAFKLPTKVNAKDIYANEFIKKIY
ncbi:MAG: ABC transporter substrate-binding protein [Nitrospinota bacterium]